MTATAQQRGERSFHAGLAAEDSVARAYLRRGHDVAERRWRGAGGEIDLIVRDGDGLIFVEVKKSATFARAANRITARQMARMFRAAEEYVANEPAGSLTEMRFDVALVDASGAVRLLENAFAMG